MRRMVIVLVVLVVAAGGIYFGSQRLLRRPAAEPTPSTLQTEPVRSGMVRCRGRVIPRRWLSLVFGRSGRVARVVVEEGATVQAGDLLAELEAEDMSLQARAAEQRLLAAQTQLAQARATPVPESRRAAEAQVAAAAAALDALRAGATDAELERARLAVDQARNALWGAQATRDAIGGDPNAGAALAGARAHVASAEIAVRLAEIAYEEVKAGPAPEALAAGVAALAQAQERLAALTAGLTPEELQLLEVAVAEAELALAQVAAAQAEGDEQGRILAPFDGVVTSIGIQEGQAASAGAETIILADLSELIVETTDLTELDIAAVRPEQPVEVTIPGSGAPILQARVSFISPQVTISPAGQSLYRVLVSLNRPEPSLRWGMTAYLAFGKKIK